MKEVDEERKDTKATVCESGGSVPRSVSVQAGNNVEVWHEGKGNSQSHELY